MAFRLENDQLFQPLNVAKTLSDKQSLVSKYQTLILSSGEDEVAIKRIYILFKVFDEVSGQLGVFKELFQEIRKELVEAVFSDSIHPGITNDEAEIKRIPHLEQVKKLFKERQNLKQDCENKVESAEKKLFEKQQQYEEQLSKYDELNQELDQRDELIEQLRAELRNLDEEKSFLQKEFQLFQQATESEIQEMKLDYQNLQEDLRIVTAERNLCKPYKEGYDRMQVEFQNIGLKTYEEKRAEEHKPALLSQKEKLISDIKSASKLRDQVLKGQNLLLKEYDAFQEKHLKEIRDGDESDPNGRSSSLSDPSIRNVEAETADHQLIQQQKRFHENIQRVENEVNLLNKHRAMLEEQLLAMMQASEGDRDSALELLKQVSSAGEGGEDSFVQGDPFVVNERVFSKYSLLLFVSMNGGKTYSELGGSNYCHQCFEKTTVCPHKLQTSEVMITLPTGASHLRLTRPTVKIDQQKLQKGMQQVQLLDRKSALPPLQQRSRGSSAVSALTADTQAQLDNEEQNVRFPNRFAQVWEDYRARTDTERQQPILQPKQLVESLIEQFYATCLWDDEYTPDDEEGYSVLDNFYEFLYSRYLQEEIVFLVAYDFFTSLQVYAESDQHLQVFSHILCNNFDGSVFRYLIVMNDLVNLVDWQHSEDFRQFIQIAFPFMLDDDIETFQISFVAFCENKVSREAVYRYLLYTMLRYRDPYFLEMEAKCLQSPMAEFGFLSEREYLSVAETVCDNSLDHVARRLFMEAAAANEREGHSIGSAPVAKVAQILSYLSLLQVAAAAREEIPERIQQHRIEQKIETRTEARPQEELKWNYSAILHLAKCMARSEQFRQQVAGFE